MKKDPVRPIYYALRPESILEFGRSIEDDMAKALFFFAYLTGARISEIKDFSINRMSFKDDFVIIPLKTLKKRNTSIQYRNIVIPIKQNAKCLENVMWNELAVFLNSFKNFDRPFTKWGNMSEYLIERGGSIQIEAKVKDRAQNLWFDKVISKPPHPHLLRHFRATHLVDYYDVNAVEMMHFFVWNRSEMAIRYTQIKDMISIFKS